MHTRPSVHATHVMFVIPCSMFIDGRWYRDRVYAGRGISPAVPQAALR
jgi:hypothetical protein